MHIVTPSAGLGLSRLAVAGGAVLLGLGPTRERVVAAPRAGSRAAPHGEEHVAGSLPVAVQRHLRRAARRELVGHAVLDVLDLLVGGVGDPSASPSSVSGATGSATNCWQPNRPPNTTCHQDQTAAATGDATFQPAPEPVWRGSAGIPAGAPDRTEGGRDRRTEVLIARGTGDLAAERAPRRTRRRTARCRRRLATHRLRERSRRRRSRGRAPAAGAGSAAPGTPLSWVCSGMGGPPVGERSPSGVGVRPGRS